MGSVNVLVLLARVLTTRRGSLWWDGNRRFSNPAFAEAVNKANAEFRSVAVAT
jgi:hypothetical protein